MFQSYLGEFFCQDSKQLSNNSCLKFPLNEQSYLGVFMCSLWIFGNHFQLIWINCFVRIKISAQARKTEQNIIYHTFQKSFFLHFQEKYIHILEVIKIHESSKLVIVCLVVTKTQLKSAELAQLEEIQLEWIASGMAGSRNSPCVICCGRGRLKTKQNKTASFMVHYRQPETK